MLISLKVLLENKENIEVLSDMITEEDVTLLVEWLSDKNDEIRYTAFLLIKEISKQNSSVYPYWNIFAEKMGSNNSYQRSIGLMLLSENIKWDEDNKILYVIDNYLSHCNDEKFITARQSIQGLKNIVSFKTQLHNKIADYLMNIDILKRKDSQQKLILTDILYILADINKITPNDAITDYLCRAITGEILDKKTIKAIEKII